jgi:hypothetical protein
MKTGGLSHPRKLRSRQGYAFSALFPEIRDLSTMKGLLDLKWQGYGFRAANLCFKAHLLVTGPISLPLRPNILAAAN